MSYKREFVEFMVEAGVLTFGDFTLKSGRRSSYFINTGNYRTGAQATRLGGFYAQCIADNMAAGNISSRVTTLFGPAYKGIPLSVAAAVALWQQHGIDLGYCFNRKEAKDHGEGGSFVGAPLKDGDRILIIEDVITAGTALREVLPLLKAAADVQVEGLVISVDRMEKGQSDKTAVREIEEEFGIKTYPLVTVREIIDLLHNKPVNGQVLIDDQIRTRMEAQIG